MMVLLKLVFLEKIDFKKYVKFEENVLKFIKWVLNYFCSYFSYKIEKKKYDFLC